MLASTDLEGTVSLTYLRSNAVEEGGEPYQAVVLKKLKLMNSPISLLRFHPSALYVAGQDHRLFFLKSFVSLLSLLSVFPLTSALLLSLWFGSPVIASNAFPSSCSLHSTYRHGH